jgi:hypothetical protein
LRVFYCFVLNLNNFQTQNICDISELTLIKIKEYLHVIIKYDLNTNIEKIGGVEKIIQLDETAVCRGRIISNPSSTSDDNPYTQWLLGGIEESDEKRFFICLIPDRKKATLLECFKKYILNGSVLRSDGYPSYPSAVGEFGSRHKVVNHTIGFVNEVGQHTNLIENL